MIPLVATTQKGVRVYSEYLRYVLIVDTAIADIAVLFPAVSMTGGEMGVAVGRAVLSSANFEWLLTLHSAVAGPVYTADQSDCFAWLLLGIDWGGQVGI